MTHTTTSPSALNGLPTPAPSTDIPGKPSPFAAHTDDSSFPLLPPAAIPSTTRTARTGSSPSSSSSSTAGDGAKSDSSYRPGPISPASFPKSSRRRGVANRTDVAVGHGVGYSLPPPPTRSRKIIQMKPRGVAGSPSKGQSLVPLASSAGKGAGATTTAAAEAAGSGGVNVQSGGGAKRKLPTAGVGSGAAGASTAATRKIARKTAHSLIERRRRSKMNEEFTVLKDMIPACTGQEMHKLAILQASIEYMRYLEQCLSDLKSAHSAFSHPLSTSPAALPNALVSASPTTRGSSSAPSLSDIEEHDHEMPDLPPSISPAIMPHNSPTSPRLASAGTTTPTSPFYHPPSEPLIHASGPPGSQFATPFALSSPALRPVLDDQEATAALLMLNTDRRSWSERGGGSGGAGGAGVSGSRSDSVRGMSVRDLLSA